MPSNHLILCRPLLLPPSVFPSISQSVQSLSRVQLFETPWTAAHQASLSFTISLNLLKLMSTESVAPSNHLILCCPLLLLPSIFPSIRVFSKESALHIRWLKCWTFSFSISPSSEYSLERMMLELKLQYFGHHLCKELTHRKRLRCWERLRAGGEGGNRG